MKILITDNWEHTVGEMTSQYTAGVTYEVDEETAKAAVKAKTTNTAEARTLAGMKPLKAKNDGKGTPAFVKVSAELAAAKKETKEVIAEAKEEIENLNDKLAKITKERNAAIEAGETLAGQVTKLTTDLEAATAPKHAPKDGK